VQHSVDYSSFPHQYTAKDITHRRCAGEWIRPLLLRMLQDPPDNQISSFDKCILQDSSSY
jgi:hypothetical protein